MVSLRGIHKSYPMGQDRLKVLKGIDLSVEAGEYRLQDARPCCWRSGAV